MIESAAQTAKVAGYVDRVDVREYFFGTMILASGSLATRS
jgi:hypothetical protein